MRRGVEACWTVSLRARKEARNNAALYWARSLNGHLGLERGFQISLREEVNPGERASQMGIVGLLLVREEEERDGKVVRERAVSRRGRPEVRVVVENGDRRREDGTERDRRGKEKAIETRRPRERTGSVSCEVFVMGGPRRRNGT